MRKLSILDIPLKNKKVLLRVDFNVPQNEDGSISDDTRIQSSLPTIEFILNNEASVILMSHLGRPKGKKEPKFSLAPVAKRLSDLLKRKVLFATDCIGPGIERMASNLRPGDILFLENLRYYPAEEEPDTDPTFAEKLAKLGDVYVNDAFGTAHRAHSSTAVIAKYFPKSSAAGLLLQKEIDFLGTHFKNPKHPFYAIIGGAKVSTKMGVIEALLSKVDALFIGGGMAYTFFKAQGISIGDSIHEDELIPQAKKFLELADKKKIPVYLPLDLGIGDHFDNQAKRKIIEVKEGIPNGWQGMDIGPKTLKLWEDLLQKAAMIFWNGPLGVFEFSHFAEGTNGIAKTLSKLKNTITIVGGGDSVAAINQLQLSNKFSHVSTGGGASLEYIELGHLPGIDALTNI